MAVPTKEAVAEMGERVMVEMDRFIGIVILEGIEREGRASDLKADARAAVQALVDRVEEIVEEARQKAKEEGEGDG